MDKKKRKEEKKKKRKRAGIIAGMTAFFCIVCAVFSKEPVCAAEENAKTFYEANPRELVFVPDGNANGNIYYATAERDMVYTFRNLGYRFVVKDQEGTVVEMVNYKFGCHVFPLVDVKYTEDRMVQYQLFRLNLREMKQRMKPETKEKIEAGECTIVAEGCLVRRNHGKDAGALGEYGEITGDVYCTVEEMEASGLFTETEKQEAVGYYNKEIYNLFYEIKTEAGEGIKTITGGGNYCYGDRAKLTAELEDGWRFLGWSGASEARTKSISFRVKQSGTYKASAKRDEPPEITAEDLYYPVSYITDGRMTEELFVEYIRASDKEDGEIPYGVNARNAFGFVDYAETDFDCLKKGGSVTETLYAVDSGGNRTEKKITIHFVDTAVRTGREASGMPRLISDKYYWNPGNDKGSPLRETEGGLPSDSCWVIFEDYKQLLESALGFR